MSDVRNIARRWLDKFKEYDELEKRISPLRDQMRDIVIEMDSIASSAMPDLRDNDGAILVNFGHVAVFIQARGQNSVTMTRHPGLYVL